jgi:class 3 adenylate cyclase
VADVFLSYASADVDRARDVAKALQEAGFSVWWDRELLSGERFERTIQRELNAAAAVVVLWTSASVESEWVYSEARRGNQRGALVQVRTSEVGIDDLPAPFDVLHCPAVDEADALVRSVAALVRSPGAPASATEPVAPSKERKAVAVLVAGLEASGALDLEEVEVLVASLEPELRAQVERFGGTVDHLSGGELVAVFGAPRAHEDDPERAVRAGLGIRDTVAGSGLTVRLGVATGEALVTGTAVAGDVTGAARRLQALAPAGAVLTTDEAYAATRASLDFVRHGDAWLPTGSRGSVGEALTDTSIPMVGREDELTQLQRAFLRSVRDASVQLVTVVAEPGMGKSRLVQAFGDWLDDQEELVTWRQARIPPYGETLAYEALAQIVKAQAEILDSDPAEVVVTKLTDAVHAVVAGTDVADQEDWLVARLSPLAGAGSAEADREELFTAWTRFVEMLAERAPLVLVIEDLHWADAAMLDFLTHLLEHAVGVPLLVVTTTRPELFDRVEQWGAGHRNSTTLSLSRLSDQEAARLVAALPGADALPPELHQALVDKAAGNPLYAREYLGVLATNPGSELDSTLPASVQAVIAARLDTLPAELKQLLQAAAVVGDTFWTSAISALTGREEAALDEQLRDLVRRDFLRRSHTSRMAGQSEYVFAHALISDVNREQLSSADLLRLHEAAGEWHAARLDPDPTLVALHYTEAHRAARFDAAAGSRLSDVATTWNGRAADHLMATDPASAVGPAELAVSLAAGGSTAKVEALVRLGKAQVYCEEPFTGEKTLREAASLAERLAAPTLLAQASNLLAGALIPQSGRLAEARELSEASVADLERLPPSAELVEALMTRGWICARERHDHAALENLTRAVDVVTQIDASPRLSAEARSHLGVQRFLLGDRSGLDDIVEARELAERHSLTTLVLETTDSLAFCYGFAGPASRAVPEARAGLRLAEQVGVQSTFRLSNNLAEYLIISGALNEAVEVCERSTRQSHDLSDRSRLEDWHLLRSTWAWALGLQGARSGRTLISAAASEIDSPTDSLATACVVLVAAELHVHDTRGRALDDVLKVMGDAAARQFLDGCLARVARLLATTDHLDLVETLIAETPRGLALYEDNILSARATLAESGEHYAEALELHLEAAAAWASYGYLVEEAYALLGAARCASRLGQPAREHANRARDLMAGMGATTLVRQAEELLAELDG